MKSQRKSMNDHEQMRTAVHEYLLAEHRDLIEQILACANTVIDQSASATTNQSTSATSDENGIPADERVGDLLRTQLDHEGVTERLPAVLSGAVEAIDASLSAEPVAAPPYIVIAKAGPLMRATLDTERLVITIEVFRVDRNTRQFVRTTDDPDEAITVEVRDHR
jgi:hypothetical protein